MGTWKDAVKAAEQTRAEAAAEEAAAQVKVRAAITEREAAEQRRAAAEKTIQDRRNAAFAAMLTPDLIDVLAPEHDGRECSDDNTCNDYDGCARCALLSASTCGTMPTPWRFTVEVFP